MTLSERMKNYEAQIAEQRLTPNLPVCVRLDGKAFHSWTRGLARPYDERLFRIFDHVTAFLVEESNAVIGYTQSDEITLILYNGGKPESQIFFDGRVAKLNSVLASMATAKFNALVPEFLPEKIGRLAYFDCRVWEVPNIFEAVCVLLWRESDAVRNSIAMAAQAHLSPKQLHKKNGNEMREMLLARWVNWSEYPVRFQRGAYFQRRVEQRKFSAEELARLPEKHEARRNSELTIARSVVWQVFMPPLREVMNKIEAVFDGEEPKSVNDFAGTIGADAYEQAKHVARLIEEDNKK